MTGYTLAKYAPPIDPNALGHSVNLANVFDNPMKVIELTCIVAVSWLLSPISVSSVSSQSGFLSLGTEVASIPSLFLAVLFFVLFPLVFWSLKSRLKHMPISILLIFFGIFIQAGFTVVARFVFYEQEEYRQIDGQEEYLQIVGLLHVRYAPIMQLLATLFWIFLIIASIQQKRVLSRVPAFVVSVLFLATTGWALLNLPKSIAESSYSGRISKTNDQLNEFKKCSDPSSVVIYSEIQPSIPSALMCEITATVSGLND